MGFVALIDGFGVGGGGCAVSRKQQSDLAVCCSWEGCEGCIVHDQHPCRGWRCDTGTAAAVAEGQDETAAAAGRRVGSA